MNRRPPRNGEIIEKTTNTLLVDGNALFKWGFFGAKDMYNHHGVHVGGLYQFLTILRKLLVEDLYHRVFVFWDGNLSGKLRYEIYEPYKSSRGKDFINGTHPIDETELLERKLVWDYLSEMYIRQLRHEVIESDDFIGYYCLNKKPNEKITICSTDRDFCQLISNDIRFYILDLRTYVDNTNFSEYFCYKQENSILVKTMIGDNSDCIRGVKGLKDDKLISLFPEIKERVVTLDDIINSAKKQQEERISSKKKPLIILDNIINQVTLGPQGNRLYEINERLVNLRNPMMTKDGIEALNELIDGTLDNSGRELKNVFKMMRTDGLNRVMGESRFDDFLTPFKLLINREKNLN